MFSVRGGNGSTGHIITIVYINMWWVSTHFDIRVGSCGFVSACECMIDFPHKILKSSMWGIGCLQVSVFAETWQEDSGWWSNSWRADVCVCICVVIVEGWLG